MNVSVRANCRVAEAARGGIPPALNAAFRGGAITGMLVVGLALLGVAGYYGLLTAVFDEHAEGGRRRAHRPRLRRLADLRLRPARRRHLHEGRRRRRRPRRQGRGRHPRGRPAQPGRHRRQRRRQRRRLRRHGRRPVRDLRGHRRRGHAARRPDVLGANATAVALYPLVLGGVAIIASIIGTFAVKSAAGNVERALYQGLVVSGIIAAAAFYPVTKWIMDDLRRPRTADVNISVPSVGDLYLCSLIGLGVTALLFLITDYYTSTRFGPVKKTAEASQTGHATNIISGLVAGHAGHGPAGARPRARHLRRQRARRHLRHRRRRHGASSASAASSSRSTRSARSPTTPAASPRWPTCPRTSAT